MKSCMKRSFIASAIALALVQTTGVAWAQSTSTPGSASNAAAPSPTAATPPSTASATDLDAVVVTGSRVQTTVGKSTTPVSVISAATLQATGQPNLRDALIELQPSITRTAFGSDNAELTDALQMDGLSPDHVLVLVNGKRRHGSANMVEDGGLDQGSTGVDLDMIPTDLIDHIEVLRDGAAAQYGSDAIAGVINIILKDNTTGGAVSSTNGQTYQGDGFRSTETASFATTLGENGFLDLSAEYDRINHTIRTGPDYADGAYGIGPAAAYVAAHGYSPPFPIGPAYKNLTTGDTASTRQLVGFNGGYDFNDDVEAYAFGTFGHRYAEGYENYRPPFVEPTVYPNGFTPTFTDDENDYSITGGVKDTNFHSWDVDLSTTYGGDRNNLGLIHSINESITDSPLSFDLGAVSNSQLTTNLDFTRPFQLSAFAQPLNFSFGFEQRRETYQIQPGDVYSYEDGGPSSETGFNQLNAGSWERNVLGAYVDFATHITDQWQADLSGRYEHYSDFGATRNEKFSTRYDFTPKIAVRASASTGFHAPSLAEEHFSTLAVGAFSATGQLAPNSPAAAALGAQPLKPEQSTNLNVGLVLNPLDNWNITADAYQIDIRHRIVAGGSESGQIALDALAASGISVPGIPPGNVSVWYFTNGADTRTQGVDITSVYHAYYEGLGKVDWNFSANINNTRVTNVALNGAGVPELNLQQISYLTSSTPHNRVIFGPTWHSGNWSVSVHENRWGSTSDQLTYSSGPDAWSISNFYNQHNAPMYTTDFDIDYSINKHLQVAIGANNAFNKYPSRIPYIVAVEGQQYDLLNSQAGWDGGYYYARIRYSF
jgi:iron complex outermembrane recepter protein